MKSYAERLKDPRWQRKRLEIMNRDSFACMECKSDTKTLHVHHKEYRSGAEPWDYPDENFETLCDGCHENRHSKVNEIQHANSETNHTKIHRLVAFLCHLSLTSCTAQRIIRERLKTIHEEYKRIDGVTLLERILCAAPDPTSNAEVNTFMSGLSESDRLALAHETRSLEGVLLDMAQAAEQALALLYNTVLQRRDDAVKSGLKEPGLTPERMIELLHEAKEISVKLRGIGQRSAFDADLPASTFKAKAPTWKSVKR